MWSIKRETHGSLLQCTYIHFSLQMPEVKCLVLDAIEYHNNPHLQPLMSSEATEMRGAQDVVMMISALEDATLVQYKVSAAYRLEYRANVIKYMYNMCDSCE